MIAPKNIIYSYAHLSGGLTKVGMTTTGDALSRQLNYIENHGLVGFDATPIVFPTQASNKSQLIAIEKAIHGELAQAGGVFRSGRTGAQEIFAIKPNKAAAVIRKHTGPAKFALLKILMQRGLVTLGITDGAVVVIWLSYEGWRIWERRNGRNRPAALTACKNAGKFLAKGSRGAVFGASMFVGLHGRRLKNKPSSGSKSEPVRAKNYNNLRAGMEH